jgi:hypothetical protein
LDALTRSEFFLLVEQCSCTESGGFADTDNTRRKAPRQIAEEPRFFFWRWGPLRFQFGEPRLTLLGARGTALTHPLHGHLLIGALYNFCL